MKKLLAANSISSLIYQIIAIVCGFIVPRLILSTYGSDVNGLVNSITQFLGFISFLDMGVSAVTRSALYKPLADRNNKKISEIMSSSGKFYRRLAMLLLVYVVILIFVYPVIAKQKFDFGYTAFLIAAISISSFAQYYFGLVNSLLLNADQKGYIPSIIQSITLVVNTAASITLMQSGASIQTVKLTTSLIFLVRPIFLNLYVRKKYQINKNVKYEKEPLEQKWNGLAQHVAAVVLSGTDSAILTVFSSLSSVSVYSVYNLVLMGVKQLLDAATAGFDGLFGKLYAKKEISQLNNIFGWFEWGVHTAATFIFGCTAVLIIPFVSVYTIGITDADYYQPLFATVLTLATAMICIRLPYIKLILIAGHYKQTQQNYTIAVIMNLAVSIVMVWKFDLIGVAVGTLAAMVYQTVWMAWYDSKNIICWEFKKFLKQIIVDIITVVVAVPLTKGFVLKETTYFAWFILAVQVALVWLTVVLVVNLIFYRERIIGGFKMAKNILIKNKGAK